MVPTATGAASQTSAMRQMRFITQRMLNTEVTARLHCWNAAMKADARVAEVAWRTKSVAIRQLEFIALRIMRGELAAALSVWTAAYKAAEKMRAEPMLATNYEVQLAKLQCDIFTNVQGAEQHSKEGETAQPGARRLVKLGRELQLLPKP